MRAACSMRKKAEHDSESCMANASMTASGCDRIYAEKRTGFSSFIRYTLQYQALQSNSEDPELGLAERGPPRSGFGCGACTGG